MEDQDTCNSSTTTCGGARYKLMSPAKLPISRTRATCITIPPGLSPTSFLESPSPVLLTNVKAEPSPTTGSFFKPQAMQGSSSSAAFLLNANYSDGKSLDESNCSFFEFKVHAPGLSAGLEVSAGFNIQRSAGSECYRNGSEYESYPSRSSPRCEIAAPKEQTGTAPICMLHEETNGVEGHKVGVNLSDSGHKDCVAGDRSSDDGYNWRKYGQKVVKGSEFPRSYYKCTHPNCEVKKIFERSYSGKITEIVYKGIHDHPKPQPTRRLNPGALTSSIREEDNNADKVLLCISGQPGLSANNSHTPNLEMSGTPVASDEDGATPQLNNTTIDEIDDDDDPYSKRRRMDYGRLDVMPVVKPIREPRVVVQTISEVDILDDGYRWRKYGQKVVRGNPNPRSYYKCTSSGCQVRKHVERASHDPKAVITTYEGKHNHDVPSARSGTHDVNLRNTTTEGDDGGISLEYKPQLACYGYGGVYGASRENEVDDVSTLKYHSSNPYPQNLGRILSNNMFQCGTISTLTSS